MGEANQLLATSTRLEHKYHALPSYASQRLSLALEEDRGVRPLRYARQIAWGRGIFSVFKVSLHTAVGILATVLIPLWLSVTATGLEVTCACAAAIPPACMLSAPAAGLINAFAFQN